MKCSTGGAGPAAGAVPGEHVLQSAADAHKQDAHAAGLGQRILALRAEPLSPQQSQQAAQQDAGGVEDRTQSNHISISFAVVV